MNKLQLYGYVACAVGAAAFVTGLLPRDKISKVSTFMHKYFGQKGTNVYAEVSTRMQLIVFGVFFLVIGLFLSGLIRR